MPDLAVPTLLVDDYAGMRRTIRSMLQQIGFTDITEDDGKGALALIRDRKFGLIVSDLMMTPVNGLELLKEVRGNPRLAGTLFVMVTGAAHTDLVLAARDLKVDGYVVKPFDTNTLRRKLFGLVDRVALAEAEERPAAVRTVGVPSNGEAENAEIQALKAAINALYELLDARIRAGDTLTPHDDLVSLIRVYIDRAVAAGVEPHYRQQLDAMLGKLPAVKPVVDGGLGGVLYRVEQPSRVATAVPDRRAKTAARPDERRSGREGRRYKRFGTPALHVTVADRTYRTVDWSIGGLAIGGYSGALQPDKQIKITLRVEGDEDERLSFSDRMVVVRNNSAAGTLALKFSSQASATLKVLEYLTRRQQKPVEATRPPAALPT